LRDTACHEQQAIQQTHQGPGEEEKPRLQARQKRGKGSHAMIYLGDKLTVLPNHKDEIGPGLLKSMCDDLGITRDDLK
jgi:hypothetical protein